MTTPNVKATAHSTLIHGPVVIFGYKFEEWDTGGGRVALGCQLPDGSQILITGYNEGFLPTCTDWCIAFYGADGEQTGFVYPGAPFEEGEQSDDPNGCPECGRSFGPNYTGPCEH